MQKMNQLYNFEGIEVLWRYIDEDKNLDLLVNLVVNGSICFDIEDDCFIDTFTSNLKMMFTMAFQKMEKEKISYFDLNGKKKDVVLKYVLDELNGSGKTLGVTVKNGVLVCKAKEEDEKKIKDFVRRADLLNTIQAEKEKGNELNIFQLLNDKTEWECNACGATTSGLICEYCGTPKIKF